MFAIDVPATDTKAVAVGSTTFDLSMADGQRYRFVSTTDCWINQHATAPTAVAAADANVFVKAGEVVVVDGTLGAKLAVIRATADGSACLSHLRAR